MARDRNKLVYGDLRVFAKQLEDMPKDVDKAVKKMLREQGTKLRRKTVQRARATVNRTAVHRKEYTRAAGTYHKSIKRGKVFLKDGVYRVRVYSNDAVAHLMEYGWRNTARNGKSGKLVEGQEVFANAEDDYADAFYEAVDDMLDEVINKL